MAAESTVEEVLALPLIPVDRLRELSFAGFSDPHIRSLVWKIWLGLLAPAKSEWPSKLQKERDLFAVYVKDFAYNPETATPDDAELFRRIRNDVNRTLPEVEFFQKDGVRLRDEPLERILSVYCKLNRGIGYIQGMSELLGLLYFVFYHDEAGDGMFKGHVEADTFVCFMNLISEIRDNFNNEMDHSDFGVMNDMWTVNRLLRHNDYGLWFELDQQSVDYRLYTFRWLTLLLSQEFPFSQTLRLWDAVLADERRYEFVRHFSCAMIICARDRLIGEPFNIAISILQNYPLDIPVDAVMPTAMQIRAGTYVTPHKEKHELIKEGVLKRRLTETEWEAAWFVLHKCGPAVELVRCTMDKSHTKISGLDLARATVTEARLEEDGEQIHAFRIVKPARGTFYLAAVEAPQKWQWMSALSKAIRATGPAEADSPGIPTPPGRASPVLAASPVTRGGFLSNLTNKLRDALFETEPPPPDPIVRPPAPRGTPVPAVTPVAKAPTDMEFKYSAASTLVFDDNEHEAMPVSALAAMRGV